MDKFKLIILGILLFTTGIRCQAEGYWNEFLKNHDIPEECKNLKSENPSEFWVMYARHNDEYQKFLKTLKKRKRDETETLLNIENIPRFNIKYHPSIIHSEETKENVEWLKSMVGNFQNIDVAFSNDDFINAFTTLSDNGYVVVLSSGIFEAPGITAEILYGILAHEYAHACVAHIHQAEYRLVKMKRKKNLLSALAVGFTVLAAGVDAYVSGLTNSNYNGEMYEEGINKIKFKTKYELYKYRYSFYREQEMEADLIAYRFMEWAGYGGENYIEALKMIENIQMYTGEAYISQQIDSSHPSTRERIRFLEYVKAN